MKSGDMSKATVIAVAILSLAMYAIAQTSGGPATDDARILLSGMPGQSTSDQHQNQNTQSQKNSSP